MAVDRVPVVCSAWVDAEAAGGGVLFNADLGMGAPEQLQAIVPVGITVDNQGEDVHQVLIIRANDGVTQPFSEMLELPPEQRTQLATALGSIEVEPGETSTMFVRLTPGR